MDTYKATVEWRRGDARFLDNRYSRVHQWRFDGGAVVAATASEHIVPIPLSEPANVDPEEAFVAALSSCHMLWFLSIAAKAGVVVDFYVDSAYGVMSRNPEGRMALTRIVLRPRIALAEEAVLTREELQQLHDKAHHECFIANSVRSEIVIEPGIVPA